MTTARFKTLIGCTLLALSCHAQSAQPWIFTDNTRYLAMGDSLTAGYGAIPMTEGYAYLLYEQGAYDSMPNTLFANTAVPGATSSQVLAYQVPLATQSGFAPHVITMTVGGNDLFTIMAGADPQQVIANYRNNLASILLQLCAALPATRIYVANLYTVRNFPIDVDPVVQFFNQVVGGVTLFANASGCNGRAKVVDLYAAFSGPQEGLLLINRTGASFDQAHPTNAGYRVIAKAFAAAR